LAIKTALGVKTDHVLITAIGIRIGRMGAEMPSHAGGPMQLPAPAPGLVVALSLMV